MAIEHRWAILDALYRTKGMAPQSLYDNELEAKLGVSWNRLRDDVDYLAQREFVSVTRSQRGSRIYTRLRLVAAGIDLIEGSTEDAAVPPPDALPDATSGPVTWTRSAIRELLKDAFTDEDLTSFCFDRFPAVHDDFAQGMSKGQKVQMLLEYCVRHHEVETLLEAVRAANPAQYERHEATIRPL